MKVFGEMIKTKRHKKNLTQGFVAHKVKTSQGHMSKIERGEMLPNLVLSLKLFEVLGIKVNDVRRILL
jgi:transcriptional regulator with XRE-family HTH domain